MNDSPVRRGPGRRKGSVDYRPSIIRIAEQRKVVQQLYEALDEARLSSDYKRFYALAKAVELTLKASPRSVETTAATNFVLSIYGLKRPEIRGEVIEHSPVALGDGGEDGEDET
jgi:hypothetical protein